MKTRIVAFTRWGLLVTAVVIALVLLAACDEGSSHSWPTEKDVQEAAAKNAASTSLTEPGNH